VHESSVWKDVILKESGWFYVNYMYASKILKDVFKNYKNYLPKAKQQAKLSRESFSISAMNKKVQEFMNRNVAEEVELSLPKSNTNRIELPKLKKIEA
jgi:N-glycosylase/DNA lyase